jgi:hypothetical protein
VVQAWVLLVLAAVSDTVVDLIIPAATMRLVVATAVKLASDCAVIYHATLLVAIM